MKSLKLIILICLIVLVIPFKAYAVEDLEDIIGNEDVEESEVIEEVEESSNADFISGLADAMDLTANTTEAAKVTSGFKKAVASIVQVLLYIIMGLLTLRCILDVAYISLPFCRGILDRGTMAQMGNGGMMGGFNRFGGAGLGGGFGTGFGGPGMAGSGMMGAGMGNPMMQQRMGLFSRIPLVSNSAINAVMISSRVGPDGKTVNPYRIYIKDMFIIVIVTGILLVLTVTGALSQLGLALGMLLANAISALKDTILGAFNGMSSMM